MYISCYLLIFNLFIIYYFTYFTDVVYFVVIVVVYRTNPRRTDVHGEPLILSVIKHEICFLLVGWGHWWQCRTRGSTRGSTRGHPLRPSGQYFFGT